MRKPYRKRWLVGGLALAAAGAVILAVWPRGPQLELYTSPPMTVFGKPKQVQLLIPTGWKAEAPQPIYLGETGNAGQSLLFIRPQPANRWLPAWLRRLFYGEPEQHTFVEIGIGHPDDQRDVATYLFRTFYGRPRQPAFTGPSYPTAHRSVQKDIGYHVRYYRTNRAAFEATYRPICDSFKVLR
jgi:hypothetical protein